VNNAGCESLGIRPLGTLLRRGGSSGISPEKLRRPMLPAFLHWPAAGRCRHPAPDAAKFIAQAIGSLKPQTLMCADGITNALLSQQQDDARDGPIASAGAGKRAAFESLAQSFAAETATLSDSEADRLVSALLVVMAASNGEPWAAHRPCSYKDPDPYARLVRNRCLCPTPPPL
jgi:hypothetical protein